MVGGNVKVVATVATPGATDHESDDVLSIDEVPFGRCFVLTNVEESPSDGHVKADVIPIYGDELESHLLHDE